MTWESNTFGFSWGLHSRIFAVVPPGLALFVFSVYTLGLFVNQASAIDIEETIWGFDGQVAPNEFNPLSILISNPTAEEVEGTFRLQKTSGGIRKVGALIEKDYFISSFSSKWIQFYPYCIGDWEEWTLTWGDDGDESAVLPKLRIGGRAYILLVDPEAIQSRGGALKRLPDNLFPPSVTATSSLHTVVLDHVPRWEESRRTAFLDWLHSGGTVRVIHGDNGQFPRFPESLNDLNSPLPRTSVKAGIVVRNAVERRDLDVDFVKTIQVEGQRIRQQPSSIRKTRQADETTWEDLVIELAADRRIFNLLKSMDRASRSWPLIYLMALSYLVVVFPGCYLISRKTGDYRIVHLNLLGAIALFTVGFLFVGRRDYTESTTIRSVAYARQLDGGYFDVMQWSDATVTYGDMYSLEHSGSGRVYATCEDRESVNGTIRNGVAGNMNVDIPPFSSRTFGHRKKMALGAIDVSVAEILETGTRLQTLTFRVGQSFPPECSQIYAVRRDRLYEMDQQGAMLTIKRSAGYVSSIFTTSGLDQYQFYFDPTFDEYQDPEEAFKTLCEPVIARSLQLYGRKDVERFTLPADRVRVFVYAPMDAAFFAKTDRFDKQLGYVLYCVDVPVSRTQ